MVLLQKSGRAKAADAEARQPKEAAIGGTHGDSVVEVRVVAVAVDDVSVNYRPPARER